MLRRALLALTFGLLAAAPAARAQSTDPSFRVVNNTPNLVEQLYASPSSQTDWGRDRLGNDVIPPGGNYIVRLPRGECIYDIRIVYQGGRSEERRNINTCNIVNLTLGERRGEPPQDQAGGGNPSFHLANQSNRTVAQLFASPSSEQSWGPDRLGQSVVEPGQVHAIRLPLGECIYDLRIVFNDRQAQERRNVNLCRIVNYVLR